MLAMSISHLRNIISAFVGLHSLFALPLAEVSHSIKIESLHAVGIPTRVHAKTDLKKTQIVQCENVNDN